MNHIANTHKKYIIRNINGLNKMQLQIQQDVLSTDTGQLYTYHFMSTATTSWKMMNQSSNILSSAYLKS